MTTPQNNHIINAQNRLNEARGNLDSAISRFVADPNTRTREEVIEELRLYEIIHFELYETINRHTEDYE